RRPAGSTLFPYTTLFRSAAEAAEGGVALGVGLAAEGVDRDVFEEVGVVAVEDGAVGHRAGEVGAEAAVHQHLQLQAAQAAIVVRSEEHTSELQSRENLVC